MVAVDRAWHAAISAVTRFDHRVNPPMPVAGGGSASSAAAATGQARMRSLAKPA